LNSPIKIYFGKKISAKTITYKMKDSWEGFGEGKELFHVVQFRIRMPLSV